MEKNVEIYPDYFIYGDGRVYSNKKKKGFLKQTLNRKGADGYYQISVVINGKVRKIEVHTLVAAAFLGPRPKGLVVNHKDGSSTNNHYSNLEYVTQKENIHHAMRTGLSSKPFRKARLFSPEGEIYEIENVTEFCKAHALDNGTLNKVLNGKIRQHKGWTGRYLNDAT